MEFPGQKAVPFSVFWGNSILFSTVVVTLYNPTNSTPEFPPLHMLASTCYLFMIAILNFGKWYLIVVLIWISLSATDAEHPFKCLWAFCMSPLEKCLFNTFAHFCNWVVCLPGVELCEFFIYFGDQTLVWGIICKYVFSYNWFSFHFNSVFLSHAEAFYFDEIPFVYSFLYIILVSFFLVYLYIKPK